MQTNINHQNEIIRSFAEDLFACLASIQTNVKASLSANRQQPVYTAQDFSIDNSAKSSN